MEGCSGRVEVEGDVVALDCRGGVRISGGVLRYEGNGAGSAQRDFAGVVGVFVGVVGGVSRHEGWFSGAARGSVARGLWSEVSMVSAMSELVESFRYSDGIYAGSAQREVEGLWSVVSVVGVVAVVLLGEALMAGVVTVGVGFSRVLISGARRALRRARYSCLILCLVVIVVVVLVVMVVVVEGALVLVVVVVVVEEVVVVVVGEGVGVVVGVVVGVGVGVV